MDLRPDRVANIYHGRAPAGSQVSAGCYRAIGEPCSQWLSDVTVGNDGMWSFSPGDVRGGDSAQVLWTSPANDDVWAITPRRTSSS
jgi:hypothetical protein